MIIFVIIENMEKSKKQEKYLRLYRQIHDLLDDQTDFIAEMATIAAVLHHKMGHYFWTGFYTLIDGELIVGPYQRPVACIKLKKNTGVCWAGINRKEAIIVEDVENFPGHIVCDSRSKSEIVIPLKDKNNNIIGVLDVDSNELASFNQADKEGLEKIVRLLS